MTSGNKKPSSRLSEGEAVIRRALRYSLLGLALLLTIAALVYLLVRKPEQAGPIQEAEIHTPGLLEQQAVCQPPVLPFTDITEQAGIDFVHVNAAYGDRLMPETIGSGAAFFDYDNDGDQDLYLVNFRSWPDHPGDTTPLHALYRNDGSGRFEAVSRQAGLAIEDYGMGVAVGDYDADGWSDLFVSTLKGNRLFRNVQGRFQDMTATAGVAGRADSWSTGAGFLDYDRDGDLDLFVLNYVKWSSEIDLEIDFRLAGLGRAYGAPSHFIGTHSYLYRNEGDGRFVDVAAEAGIHVSDAESGVPVGKGLGVAPVDYDGDGWLDLVIANDTSRNFLFHNLGNGRFEEIGALEGLAYDRRGKPTGAMGIDTAHYRNDPELAVAIGNFANEMSSLFVTVDGRPPFADEAVLEGFGPASRLALTFGVLFLDVDLDGRLDLLQANGHLEHEISRVQASQTYAQSPQLFWNCGDTSDGPGFVLLTGTGDLEQPLVGRAASYADIDNDGDLDVLITQNGRRAVLFRNDQQQGHHWLRLKLIGRTPNHEAIGARVELTAAGVTQYRTVMPTRSYLSQVELPLTFGLAGNETVDELRITWPDGTVQSVEPEKVDTTLVVTQVESVPPVLEHDLESLE